MDSIFIKNAVVITVDAKRQIFMNGYVLIENGLTSEVGSMNSLIVEPKASKVIDANGRIVMPGLFNTHMHLPQVMMRNVYDNVSDAMTKLKYYTWPIQGCYDENDALISAQLGVLEMIKSGTTAFISTGLHPRYGIDRIMQMVFDSGIRSAISKYVMDITGYALDESALHKGMWEKPEECKQITLDLIKNWNGKGNGRIQTWISPRSVGGVSDDLFHWTVDTARANNVGMTMHFSEVQNNVDYSLETYGVRPVFFAEKFGLLGPDMTFAHGIYFDDAEIELLARSGTNIAHCPCCNSKLAMGIPRVPDMLRAGVNITLANDGMGVNNTADIFREMRTSLLLHRVHNDSPNYPTAAQGIEMATINGAKAMRIADTNGSIEKGKKADMIIIETASPHMVPLNDPASSVAWCTNGSDVMTSIIDGRIVMEERKVLSMNEDEILSKARDIQQKVLDQSSVKVMHSWPIIG